MRQRQSQNPGSLCPLGRSWSRTIGRGSPGRAAPPGFSGHLHLQSLLWAGAMGWWLRAGKRERADPGGRPGSPPTGPAGPIPPRHPAQGPALACIPGREGHEGALGAQRGSGRGLLPGNWDLNVGGLCCAFSPAAPRASVFPSAKWGLGRMWKALGSRTPK